MSDLASELRGLDDALTAAFAPFWDWMEDRTVRQLVIAIVVCFAALIALSIAGGSFVPLAFGVVFWFASSLCVWRGR